MPLGDHGADRAALRFTTSSATLGPQRGGWKGEHACGEISNMDPLDVVFRHLDRWRHLPAYQLERRADIFFSVYLKTVVEEFVGVPLEDEIIPELPIKRDLIWPELKTEKSVKVDYALFAKDRGRVFFVELKTDGGSRRDAQDHYLEMAKKMGFRPIVEGIRSILMKTSAHQKYHHLAVSLARLGFLNLPHDLASHIYPSPGPSLASRLCEITVNPLDVPIEVIYVQPEKSTADRCIDFEHFAGHVARHDDPLSRLFAEHLRRWKDAAGARAPT
jgi:hypothetical protein